MNALSALIRLDLRTQRGIAVGLGVTALVMPLLVVLSVTLTARFHAEVAAATIWIAVLPLTGLVLGATMAAGDGGRAFLAARPVSYLTIVMVRLGVRLTVGGVITALAFAVPWLLDWPVALTGPTLDAGTVPLAALWLLLFLASAALASAHAERALGAAIGGLAIAMAGLGVTWTVHQALQFHQVANLGRFEGLSGPLKMAPLAGCVAVLLIIAARLSAVRAAGPPRATWRASWRLGVQTTCVLGAVLALLLVATVLKSGSVAAAQQGLAASWAQVLPDGLPVATARAKANDTARRLDVLVAPLQLEINRSEWRFRSGTSTRRQLESLDEWLRDQASGGARSTVPPPPPVSDLIARQAALLDTVRVLLNGAEAPAWDSHPGDVYGHLPNLQNHWDLARLLLAHAILSDREGRGAEAQDGVRAAFGLARGLQDRGEPFALSFAMRAQREALAVLRLVGQHEDQDPLAGFGLPEQPLVAAATEFARDAQDSAARLRLHHESLVPAFPGLPTVVSEGISRLAAPWVESQLTHLMALSTTWVQDLLARSDCPEEPALATEPEEPWPGAGALGAWQLMPAAALLSLDIQLTDAVLALEARRRSAADGAWPPPEGNGVLATCGSLRLVHSVEADGLPSIAWQGLPPYRYMDRIPPLSWHAAR